MSYASEVARGIQREADRAFDELLQSPDANISTLDRLADRSAKYKKMADNLEYSDNMRYHAGQVDTWNTLTRLAWERYNKALGIKGRRPILVVETGDKL